ncbi:MAG: hypothetical protein IJG85_04690 [Eubacteriaceae bacterium]|nr:hypothetical protein [Eubacteriaceae bacterium]
MNLKMLYPIIAIVSVAVMIVWGFLGNAWNVSWLAVLIGGCAMAIVAIINSNQKNEFSLNLL